jgi:hypothetical protein
VAKTGAVAGREGLTAEAIKAGWRHAVVKTGAVEGFAGEVGFRFFWSDAAKAFLHPNVLVFLTPEGRVARYIYGTRMDARTLELAITDADWERISNSTAVFDMLTGACFSYNYAEGRYQLNYSLLAGVGSSGDGADADVAGSMGLSPANGATRRKNDGKRRGKACMTRSGAAPLGWPRSC